MAGLVKAAVNVHKITYRLIFQNKKYSCLTQNILITSAFHQNKKLPLKRSSYEIHRFYTNRQTPQNDESQSPTNQDKKSPNLMNIPLILWPSLIFSIKNLFLSKVIIQPYFDVEFNLKEFVAGAKQAVVHVSTHLANGNFDDLVGLVDNETIQTIKTNYADFDVKQRQKLAVKKEDIFFFFAYQIGIIMESDQRFVEIMTVFHCCEGFEDLKSENLNINDMINYQDRVTVCNYRFIREFTKGVQSDWQINLLNHFTGTSIMG